MDRKRKVGVDRANRGLSDEGIPVSPLVEHDDEWRRASTSAEVLVPYAMLYHRKHLDRATPVPALVGMPQA